MTYSLTKLSEKAFARQQKSGSREFATRGSA